jgi:hypothetical protein
LSKEVNIEVINAAVPGYTAYQEVLFSRIICSKQSLTWSFGPIV